MLFKRKSGKGDSNGRHRKKDDRPQGSDAPASQPPSDENTDWSPQSNEEIASFFKNSSPDNQEQRVDWDSAARDEITAFFKAEDKPPVTPQADGELEAIRRAIAARKHRPRAGDNISPPRQVTLSEDKPPAQQPPASPDQPVAEPGPPIEPGEPPTHATSSRLNWLVGYMSDDDPKKAKAPAPAPPPQTDSNGHRPPAWKKPPVSPGQAPPANNGNGAAAHPPSGNGHTDAPVPPPANDAPATPGNYPVGDGFADLDTPPSPPPMEPTIDFKVSSEVEQLFEETPPAQDAGQGPVPPEVLDAEATDTPDEKKEASRRMARQRDMAGASTNRARDRVVDVLLKKQIVTAGQVMAAEQRKHQESSREALWRILVDIEGVDREAIFAEAARIYAFPAANVEGQLDPQFARSVMDTLSEENRDRLLNLHVVPFECATEDSGVVKLVFITHDPMRAEVRRVMKELKLDRFDLYYAPKTAVDQVIADAFPRRNEYLDRINDEPMAFDLGMAYEEGEELIDEDALEAEISRSSLINLFEATLVEAVRQGASDIHIFPNARKRVEIHFRVDGRLSLWHTEAKVHPEALLAVIKDNAMNVDRFERDAAQDGYIQRWIDDVLIRFRVSVLPIANVSEEIRSESIVIRVLDDRKVITDLRKLGLLEGAMKKFEQAISQPHGMVILTGPTGSGKSTTLVAALHYVLSPEVNVLTVEDPVEYIIPAVRQIKLNFKLELEHALRAILRHDPDIVMVGEMRDRKTAELAIKLANTGHLTFSTLHTNDAPSAISRLYKMGIEPFLIAYAINLVVAQRLIRQLCPTCKTPDPDPDEIMLGRLGFTEEEINTLPFYQPGKDPQCPTCKGVGYKGRRAISEALNFSRKIRHMIVEADANIDEANIRRQATKEGMLTLIDSAREIVKMGETSVREMVRVVTTQS